MKLPDFELLFSLVSEIETLSREVGLLKIEIDFDRANVIKKVSNEEVYFKGGKPLAMNYIEATYAYSGIYDDLIPKRRQLAEKESKLKKCELSLQILKMQVDVYRTESANSRGIS